MPVANQAAREVYSKYLQPGDLVFDIGANVGAMTGLFLDMGLRVVAVEPQPDCADLINSEAVVVCAAAGAEAGVAMLYPSSTNFVTTLSMEYIAATNHPVEWLEPFEVPVVTLDNLIAEHGVPAFIKIDVEGSELQVLRGLSTPVRALSFEMHVQEIEKMWLCVNELERLGEWAFLFSSRESFEIVPFPPPPDAPWGDVYAELL